MNCGIRILVSWILMKGNGILSELSDTYIGDGNLRKVNVVIVRFLINNLV